MFCVKSFHNSSNSVFKVFCLLLVCTFCGDFSLFAQKNSGIPVAIRALMDAYPEEKLLVSFDYKKSDWRITFSKESPEKVFYWADGKLLPEDLLENASDYRTLIYNYPDEIPNPKNFTEEDIARYAESGDTENRRNAPVQYSGFLDTVYDSGSQLAMESNVKSITFLGKSVRVHQKIIEPLMRVESKIKSLAKNNASVQSFIKNLSRLDGYYWREIRDTGSRSFHSFGLAVDILPLGWANKIMYWNWEKNKDNPQWMLIPLEERWIPPLAVIAVFESEGFIWGGKWGIWDNMHFEYRPELILLREYRKG